MAFITDSFCYMWKTNLVSNKSGFTFPRNKIKSLDFYQKTDFKNEYRN